MGLATEERVALRLKFAGDRLDELEREKFGLPAETIVGWVNHIDAVQGLLAVYTDDGWRWWDEPAHWNALSEMRGEAE